MGITNNGRDAVARAMGDSTGFTGTTTSAPGNFTVTDTGAAFPASSGGPPENGGLVGHIVVMGSVYGIILKNTGTVLTIDYWHNPATPGGAAGTTPGSGPYLVAPGFGEFWMGLSVATRAFNAADAFLTNDGTTISELFFTGGGLSRNLASWSHTIGNATYQLAKTYTANGSDTLPQTIAKVGLFQHGVASAPSTTTSGMLVHQANLAATATLSAVGDNVAVTDTITIS